MSLKTFGEGHKAPPEQSSAQSDPKEEAGAILGCSQEQARRSCRKGPLRQKAASAPSRWTHPGGWPRRLWLPLTLAYLGSGYVLFLPRGSQFPYSSSGRLFHLPDSTGWFLFSFQVLFTAET